MTLTYPLHVTIAHNSYYMPSFDVVHHTNNLTGVTSKWDRREKTQCLAWASCYTKIFDFLKKRERQ